MRSVSFAVAAATMVYAVSAQYSTPVVAPSPISQQVYNDLIYYGEFVGAAQFISIGPCKAAPHGASIYANVSVASTNTQYVIFQNTERSEFIISFPGTDSLQDIETDLAANLVPYIDDSVGTACGVACLTHGGFLTAWNSVQSQVVTSLNNALKSKPNYKVTVAGVSLGGAIASLAFNYLQHAGTFKIGNTYTYGEPRVGNGAYASFTDKQSASSFNTVGKYYRTTHADDIVPTLPPLIAGYEHSLTEFWEKNNAAKQVTFDTTFRCYGEEPSNCNNLPTRNNDTERFCEHGTYGGFKSGAASCGIAYDQTC